MLKLREVADAEQELTLLAGESGLDVPVSQTHMVENLEIARSFIAPQEMIFTTGAALRDESELPELVKISREHDACGIVINLGPYIRAINPMAIAYARENGFPLFSCTWNVHMAEIMHRIGYRIEEERQNQKQLVSAMQNALLHADGWQTLAEMGFSREQQYYVAVSPTRNSFSGGSLCSFPLGEYYVTVFWDMEKEVIRSLPHEGAMAVSGLCTADGLHSAHSEARKLYQLLQGQTGIRFLEESGVCRLLLEIEDSAILERYVSGEIGKLLQYDSRKHSDLLSVLETYLRCGGSLMEAANCLSIHKNTVTNKVHKCEDILSVDLSSSAVRRDIEVALLARKVLAATK